MYKSFIIKEDAEAFVKGKVSAPKKKKTVAKKKPLIKKQKDAKNEVQNLKKSENIKTELDDTTAKKKKKVWKKKEFANYHKESRELSDYSCSKNGIVESRYTKKSK